MTRRLTTLVMASLAVATLIAQPTILNFDTDAAGSPPPGFTFAVMRQQDPGSWLIQRDGTNGYVRHAPGVSQAGYALALAPGEPIADAALTTRLRLAGGERAGGLVWRYQDPGNYYAAILDLRRGVIVMFMARNGNRITIEAEDDLELDPEAWHTLRVVHARRAVFVSIGGIRVFEERDGRLENTFGPGRVGLIATGGSTIWYDNMQIDLDYAWR